MYGLGDVYYVYEDARNILVTNTYLLFVTADTHRF